MLVVVSSLVLSLFGGPLLGSSVAQADVLKVTGFTASTSLAETQGVSYEVKNLGDLKAGGVWCEGENGSGLGSWVQADLEGPKLITSLRIWNGNWYSKDFWVRHNRAKEIDVEFSDGSIQKFTLKDEYASELVKLTKPVTTSSVKLKVRSVYNGSTFNDTVISELQVLDDAPPPVVRPQGYAASSIFPTDADANYEPANMGDGMLDSMWCEGNQKSDGTGEWVEFLLPGNTAVSKLKLRNGNATSFSIFMKSNAAKSATLTFSDGSKTPITIKPSMVEQVIDIGAHKTQKVRLTFDSVQKGKEFDDLCVSEAAFLP